MVRFVVVVVGFVVAVGLSGCAGVSVVVAFGLGPACDVRAAVTRRLDRSGLRPVQQLSVQQTAGVDCTDALGTESVAE